jgi:hypothetical protein
MSGVVDSDFQLKFIVKLTAREEMTPARSTFRPFSLRKSSRIRDREGNGNNKIRKVK